MALLACCAMLVAPLQALCEEGVDTMLLSGPMGERFEANMRNWLLTAPYENPGMLQMIFRRNQPHQAIVPWYGEFSGKYLTSAALSYRMQPGDALKAAGDYVVSQLAAGQDADGYLGVWPDAEKLRGKTPSGEKTWDAWSHYHNMLGLYLWHQATCSAQALEVLNRAADCLYDFFITQGNRMDEDKDGTDAAVGHIFALLYAQTGDARWLEVVQTTFDTFEAPFGGDYYNAGLAGKPFYKMNRTRWECLHAIETIGVMAGITGEEDYRTAFCNIWDGIRRYDRHNTGGFSSGERACGNPYDLRAIETCCTIAWMALSVDMLRLSDDPTVADELELSTWNALLGAQQPSGRSFTYNTPMVGDKKASAHDIVFQAVAGSSELNCCSVNGPRGFGMIGEWGIAVEGEQITINYYGPSETTVTTQSGARVTITQSGEYPFGSRITLALSGDAAFEGTVRLRVPFWSEKTAVSRNGVALEGVAVGTYLTLENARAGDVYALEMDMRPHFWQGNYELGGKTAIYVGPILLACDQRFNAGATDSAQPLDLTKLELRRAEIPDGLYPAPYLLLTADDGESAVTLCDFASAGQTGTEYSTWLSTLGALAVLRESQEPALWGQRLDTE